MNEIKTVLMPVDFTPATEVELRRAVEICTEFGARLILHHNEHCAPPGLSRAWDWKEHHGATNPPPKAAETQLKELLNQVPHGVEVEGKISRGAVVPALYSLARELPADLIVVASHGESTLDHESVVEQLLSRPPCAILTLHDDACDDRPLLCGEEGKITALVPTDFSAAATAATEYAFDLARKLPLSLHLLHVVSGGPEASPTAPVDQIPPAAVEHHAESEARDRLLSIVPDDLADRITCHVMSGDPVEQIITVARGECVGMVLMGEHTHNLLRRWFTRNTAREVVHQAPCPVWFVPESRVS